MSNPIDSNYDFVVHHSHRGLLHHPAPNGKKIYEQASSPETQEKIQQATMETISRFLHGGLMTHEQEISLVVVKQSPDKHKHTMAVYTIDSEGRMWETELVKKPIMHLPNYHPQKSQEYRFFGEKGNVIAEKKD